MTMIVRKRSLGLLMTASATVVGLWLCESLMSGPRRKSPKKKPPIAALEPQRASVSSAEAEVRLQRIGQTPLSSEIRGVGEERVRKGLSRVRVPFIANAGQIDSTVAYYAPTFAGTVYVTQKGQIVYSLPGGEDSESDVRPDIKNTRSSGKRSGWSLTETAVGGRARPKGEDRASTGVSYFVGNDPTRWRSGLPTFEGISLGEVWPGISLELQAHGKNVEKVFTVEPGGDPSRIRMSVAGARRLRVNETGGLVVGTGFGEVTFTPPAAFQDREGVRHPVKATYEVRGRQYGFQLSDYDPAIPVVIDPLLQATYLGGSGDNDRAYALAVHPTTGDVYVAGYTNSTNFPGTAGGAQAIYGGGGSDAFVARFNATLTTLSQAAYLGGSGAERLGTTDFNIAMAIDPTTGEVYVAGRTDSTNFPGTAGGAQAVSGGGGSDAFVARLNASLTTLIQATYLGGNGDDSAYALAIHPTSGELYVAGITSFGNFPGTAGGAQAANSGSTDTFVARFNASLTTLNQATFLGGSGSDFSDTVAMSIHPTSGEVYIAGSTYSTDFPGTAGGAQATNSGSTDAFVARLNAALTALSQATYLGSADFDDCLALAIHPGSGEVYVAGFTSSTSFPGTAGGAQPANGGGNNFDAFIARFSASLNTLNQATYLGGSSLDIANALAIHPVTGDVYVAGPTNAFFSDFPGTAGGAQSTTGGPADTFIARLNAALNTLNQATFLGGTQSDLGYTLAIHPTTGDVYVAGRTDSTNFPGTAGGAQAVSGGGGSDAFVARLSADLAAGAPPPTPTTTSPMPTSTSTPTAVPPTSTSTPTGVPPTDTPTPTPTLVPPTDTPTLTPTGVPPTDTPTPTPTLMPPADTPTSTPTATATARRPTPRNTPTRRPTPRNTPARRPTPKPTHTPRA
jgi:hypothetical protein